MRPIPNNDTIIIRHGTPKLNRTHENFEGKEIIGDIEATEPGAAKREAHAVYLVSELCKKVYVGKEAQKKAYPNGRPVGTHDCDVIGEVGADGKTLILADGKGGDIYKAVALQFRDITTQLGDTRRIHQCIVVCPPLELLFHAAAAPANNRPMPYWCQSSTGAPSVRLNDALRRQKAQILDTNLRYIDRQELFDTVGIPLFGVDSAGRTGMWLYSHCGPNYAKQNERRTKLATRVLIGGTGPVRVVFFV